jgi:hypothetical protein
MSVDQVHLFFLQDGEDFEKSLQVPPGTDGMLELGQEIGFTALEFPRLTVEIPALTTNQDDIIFFPVMVGAAIKGILLGPAQFQAGDDMGDFKAAGH